MLTAYEKNKDAWDLWKMLSGSDSTEVHLDQKKYMQHDPARMPGFL